NKVIIIYQAIKDHLFRVAGLRSWDIHGPKYQLDSNKKLVYKGHFDDKNLFPTPIMNQFIKSFLYQKILSSIQEKSLGIDNAIDLFIAVVNQSKMYAEKQFPNLEFHFIYWNNENGDIPLLRELKLLEKNKIIIHCITDIITDLKDNSSKYFIKFDGHPNATANAVISKYIINTILY
ncbi:MAG: hypothetical protein OMM_15262, partial [Candidatus Magnetoglobus multicellularis str. Araruama]